MPEENQPHIRPATVADLNSLLEIEVACFQSDRLSRRQFRHMLTRAHATTLVVEADGRVLGYILLLFSRGTSVARVHSVAVRPEASGQRLGRALVTAAEARAWEEERAYVRLEIRRDNPASLALFEGAGYRRSRQILVSRSCGKGNHGAQVIGP